MKKTFFTYSLILLSILVFGQNQETITKKGQLVIDTTILFKHFDDLQVYQYFDNDSLNGKITHSEKYDSSGRVIAKYYKDYKTDKGDGLADVITINEYDDSEKLKVSTDYYETFRSGEVQKTFFYYEDSLLKTVESFEFKRRIKADVDKGLGRPGGCIVTSDDFEKERTWKLTRLVKYQYNFKGQKKKSYSLVSQSSHNGFEYEYDEEGRLIIEKSLDENELLYTTKYEYSDNQIISILTWNKNDWGSTKRIKTYDILNKKLLKEVVIQNENEWVDEYQYDENGQLIRFISYEKDGKIGLTHIYRYRKNVK